MDTSDHNWGFPGEHPFRQASLQYNWITWRDLSQRDISLKALEIYAISSSHSSLVCKWTMNAEVILFPLYRHPHIHHHQKQSKMRSMQRAKSLEIVKNTRKQLSSSARPWMQVNIGRTQGTQAQLWDGLVGAVTVQRSQVFHTMTFDIRWMKPLVDSLAPSQGRKEPLVVVDSATDSISVHGSSTNRRNDLKGSIRSFYVDTFVPVPIYLLYVLFILSFFLIWSICHQLLDGDDIHWTFDNYSMFLNRSTD